MTDLFTHEPENPVFAASKVTPTVAERVVAEIIATHRGRKCPISIAMLCKSTGKAERDIKGLVEELVVTHRIPIGAARTDPVGYFMIEDASDLEAAVGPYRSQILRMWRRLQVLLSKQQLAELLGQLSLKEMVGDERKTDSDRA